ncbi:hypothetical protein [Natrinema sp. 74]|uniref:hypothetical protein n=1 Tax=Natrinema sp. 74 TaxID=3384159 RepID=UPI0038D3A94C
MPTYRISKTRDRNTAAEILGRVEQDIEWKQHQQIESKDENRITLELLNAESYPVKLKSGMRVAQLMFPKHRTAPEVAYSEYNGSKYNGQSSPTPLQLYEDFE